MANPYPANVTDESGEVRISGEIVFTNAGNQPGLPGTPPTITGALSTVADAPAKAVLTSIIAALVADGLATDGTT